MLDAGGAAFCFEHVENVARGAIAEELSQSFFVIGNAVFLDQRDEICGSVAGQRGLGKMRIGREEIFGLAVEVGEVAAAAAGDEDLLADAVGVFEHRDAAAALAGFDGAHQTGGAAAENQCVEMMGHVGLSG